ncbi:unnamed protein product [Nesidiocoris tenuis]|uniref:Uncharacterized protein n=1 Tax=Nesidiocoris tenuis TaxID=355587 RepID=A0A6H5FXU4_9HEMI|nr:unnamed protein product [Nesidiocoris tenuis]
MILSFGFIVSLTSRLIVFTVGETQDGTVLKVRYTRYDTCSAVRRKKAVEKTSKTIKAYFDPSADEPEADADRFLSTDQGTSKLRLIRPVNNNEQIVIVLGRRDVGGLVGVAGYRVFTGAHVGGTPAAQRLGEAARPLHRRLLSLRTIRSRVGHRARGHAGRQACPRPYQRLPHRPQELPASHVVERHSDLLGAGRVNRFLVICAVLEVRRLKQLISSILRCWIRGHCLCTKIPDIFVFIITAILFANYTFHQPKIADAFPLDVCAPDAADDFD